MPSRLILGKVNVAAVSAMLSSALIRRKTNKLRNTGYRCNSIKIQKKNMTEPCYPDSQWG